MAIDASLTTSEQKFLDQHKIPASRLYDAGGGTPRSDSVRSVMQELGKSFAFNTTPCTNGGHRLKTRAGHCIQCNHARIAYQMRYDSAGVVYLALSRNGGFVKVGTAADVNQRLKSLRSLAYGGVSDWAMQFSRPHEHAGAAEFEVHQRLKKYKVEREYTRGAATVVCKELFSCAPAVAVNAIRAVLE